MYLKTMRKLGIITKKIYNFITMVKHPHLKKIF